MKNFFSPIMSETIQITRMAFLARLVVDLNSRGKHMAYQRSIDINVRVMILTLTETVWKKKIYYIYLYLSYMQ